MKTKNMWICGVVLLTALSLVVSEAVAGSTKPNPKALAAATAKEKQAMALVNKEVSLLFDRLEKGGDFVQRFEEATMKQDKKQLLGLIREAGVRKSQVTIEEIKSDFAIRIEMCTVSFCAKIHLRW